MQKVVGLLRPDSQLGARRKSGLVVIVTPVVSEIAFQSHVPLEVVSESRTEAGRHIWDLQSRRTVEVTKRGRNSASGVQPLIAHKNIVLRGLHVLGQGYGRQHDHA